MFTFISFLYFKQSNNYVKFEPKIESQIWEDKDKTNVTYYFNNNS